MLSVERGYKFLYYIPGIIILLLSVFALYSAVRLMEVRSVIRDSYKQYAKDFMNIDGTVHQFEKTFLDYIAGDNDVTFEVTKKEIAKLNDDIANIQEKRDIYLEHMKGNMLDYELTLYRLRMETGYLASALNVYKNDKNEEKTELYDRTMFSQHERIEVIHDDINKLKNIIIRSFVYAALEGHIKEKEEWLYWLISIIGLCGLVLIVMNSRKLKELEKLHTEKKVTLELLEERLAALEAATEGIFIINANDEVTYLNGSFYTMISGVEYTDEAEHQRKKLFGKPWCEVFSRSDVEVLEEEVFPVLNEKGVWAGPFQVFTHSETSISTDMSLTRLPEGGLIGTLQDISYKKQAEKEKQELEEQFYQAQKMEAIGRLAGGVAHDFNNILAAMNGYAEFLVDDLDKDSPQRQFAENILKAGVQARALVDQMLAFSRRSGNDEKDVDLYRTLSDIIGMFSITLPKTIELHTYIASEENMVIRGSQTQISQMIMNLCVNALDAIEEDKGELRITMEPTDIANVDIHGVFRESLPEPSQTPYLRIDDISAGHARIVIGHLVRGVDYVKITVQDTGTGMSRAIMEHIFEPFFTTKPVDKGSGLGLATVHGVLATHKGFMVLDSELGSGTRFDIYLPLNIDTDIDTGEKVEGVSKDNAQEEKCTNCLHILLVEDQDNVRDMITIALERLGHKVSSAISGMDGLDMIRENPTEYSLVITDYNMPKMTGLEMAHQVALDIPDLRFILLSGYSEARMQEIIEGLSSFKAILRKPVSKKILSKVIEEVMEK